MWDAACYERFREERSRPFHDLIARLPLDHPVARAADLGCGTGELTALLLDRWPRAAIAGVDSSPEMLAKARVRAVPGRLTFVEADAAVWRPPAPLDAVVANALLQWIPDHDRTIAHLASILAPRGVLAVQMPGNDDAPSHAAIRDVSARGPWASALAGAREPAPGCGRELVGYIRRLWDAGFEGVDAWESTYVHVLAGDDAVLDWVTGTALRPLLARLDGPVREAFIQELGRRLRAAYPRDARGTLFPFRRLFWVARRRG
jgi:trans-aconitate 2-methyltransferase